MAMRVVNVRAPTDWPEIAKALLPYVRAKTPVGRVVLRLKPSHVLRLALYYGLSRMVHDARREGFEIPIPSTLT